MTATAKKKTVTQKLKFMFVIIDDRLIIADVPLWVVSYDTSTGLVISTTNVESSALAFSTQGEAMATCNLINSNTNNTFVGHVPKPH